MICVVKKVPQELRRLAALGLVAGVVTTAVIYSRGERVASEDTRLSKQTFRQPKDRQQAEGWFTATSRPDLSDDKTAVIASAIPLPRSRPQHTGVLLRTGACAG